VNYRVRELASSAMHGLLASEVRHESAEAVAELAWQVALAMERAELRLTDPQPTQEFLDAARLWLIPEVDFSVAAERLWYIARNSRGREVDITPHGSRVTEAVRV
jgi:hypothetical protein